MLVYAASKVLPYIGAFMVGAFVVDQVFMAAFGNPIPNTFAPEHVMMTEKHLQSKVCSLLTSAVRGRCSLTQGPRRAAVRVVHARARARR